MRIITNVHHARVIRVHGDLVLGSISDETLTLGEGDIRGGRAVTLIIGNDLNTVVLPDTDTPKNTNQVKKKVGQ
jgi:hypothetical protein